MKKVIEELNSTIETSITRWKAISDDIWFNKPHPEKWSNAEIIGHLVDSALNNIQRFIRAQHESAPNLFYNQNEWVRLNHYQTADKEDLMQLWASLNHQICHIIKNIPTENLELPCYFKVDGHLQTVTLRYVIEDYVEHLKQHLGQIRII